MPEPLSPLHPRNPRNENDFLTSHYDVTRNEEVVGTFIVDETTGSKEFFPAENVTANDAAELEHKLAQEK